MNIKIPCLILCCSALLSNGLTSLEPSSFNFTEAKPLLAFAKKKNGSSKSKLPEVEKSKAPLYKVIEDRAGLTIATPSLAHRAQRKLRLNNGLEVLLISDPSTPESGAALAVETGSWDDPVDRPGMAHFVEHMLFLGTEKYPEEEGYTRYLDEHGGNRNAFTMADRTVYMFSVNNNGLLGALDRFGQFFISPLFSPSGVDRESKAIHSEFCRNLPLDPWRIHYVKKELANTHHPFHTFCIGNKESLAQISQEELKTWYQTHYSANLMHLVVYSAEELDALEQKVVEIFSSVKNKNRPRSSFPMPLTMEQKEPELWAIAPVQEVQSIELTWEIPRFFGQDREIHADKILSHVLGHEGSTSLLAQLKRENLAEGLSVGNSREGHDQCLLSLTVHLTNQGVQQYEQVIARCFEAIATIRQSGIPKYVFDEVSHLEEMRYRFQSRTKIFDFVSDYAMNMVDEPIETFPRQTFIPSVYAPDKLEELIACLNPQDCLFVLVADPAISHISAQLKEKWFGVEYARIPIPRDKVAEWSQAALHASIAVPRPNPFIPKNWEIKNQPQERHAPLPHPTLVADEPMGKIYAASDHQFLVPEVSWIFQIQTPALSDHDPMSHVFADLYCHTVEENLNAISYEALSAGLSFSLSPKEGALELKIKGYSDQAIPFLKTIVQEMKNALPTQDQFDLYYDLFSRDYLNSLNVNPIKQASETLSTILFEHFPGLQKKSEALKEASYEKMQEFCHNLLQRYYVEGMMYGNITLVEAQEVWNDLKALLDSNAFSPSEHLHRRLAILPQKEQASYINLASEHPANALILVIDCGPFSFKRRAAQEILTKGLEEPFFSELRTRQQTAYLVRNWSQETERHLYSFFAIQSSTHENRELLARFELFLENSLQLLKEEVIPKERFESIRAAQIHQLEHPAENLAKMGTLLHQVAFEYDADFDWVEKRIASFRDITYEEFIEYVDEFIGKANKARLAICVNGQTAKEGLTYREISTVDEIRKETTYQGRSFFPGSINQVHRSP